MRHSIPKNKPRPWKYHVKIAQVTLDVLEDGLRPDKYFCIGAIATFGGQGARNVHQGAREGLELSEA
ncbi:MAG: hypothetical protein DMD48_15065 [Gemmatimonadetes bacterium]|nr:MAG: hypothetical protein DMD48_15065 [Gemmatimonadota bacterium]